MEKDINTYHCMHGILNNMRVWIEELNQIS